MMTSNATYRLFSIGLALMMIVSASLPAMANCAMASEEQRGHHEQQDKPISTCCDEEEDTIPSNGDYPSAEDCHDEERNSCVDCFCTYKQTPASPATASLDQAQVNKMAALFVAFRAYNPAPPVAFREKSGDFTSFLAVSSPIYLMNQVLLN